MCIIDYYTEKVLYDQLVKPSMPVIDYLTRYGVQPLLLFINAHNQAVGGLALLRRRWRL